MGFTPSAETTTTSLAVEPLWFQRASATRIQEAFPCCQALLSSASNCHVGPMKSATSSAPQGHVFL